MWTGAFWLAAFERAVKTFAQAAVGFLTADATGLLDVQWEQAASVSGFAALLSLLTSVASSKAGGTGPSLGGAEQLKDPAGKH